MKKLSLLRHAKSGWDDPVARDFDRPINARGERAAYAMGKFAAADGFTSGVAPDWILASPAVRVAETLDHFLPAAGLADLEPVWDRRIYLASSVTLADVVREVPDHVSHVLICGHNPSMEDMVFDLVSDTEDPHGLSDTMRHDVEEKFPTAALATLKLNIVHWADLADKCGTLEGFTRPRDIDSALGPELLD
jgi:phosphohistidine phosphatase